MRNNNKRWINFDTVNRRIMPQLPSLVREWLPRGHMVGDEYTAVNPKRNDQKLGSFKINMRTGRWGDFSTGDVGGDVISLCAYLRGLSQYKAARYLADRFGINGSEY